MNDSLADFGALFSIRFKADVCVNSLLCRVLAGEREYVSLWLEVQ